MAVEEEEEEASDQLAVVGDEICVVCPTHGEFPEIFGRRQWRCRKSVVKGGSGSSAQCGATMHCQQCGLGGAACAKAGQCYKA